MIFKKEKKGIYKYTGECHKVFSSFYKEKCKWADDMHGKLNKVVEFAGKHSRLFCLDNYKIDLIKYMQMLNKMYRENKDRRFGVTIFAATYSVFNPKYVNTLVQTLDEYENCKTDISKNNMDNIISEDGYINLKNELIGIGKLIGVEIAVEKRLLRRLTFKSQKGEKLRNLNVENTVILPKMKVVGNPVPPKKEAKEKTSPPKKEKDENKNILMCCFFCIGCCRNKNKKPEREEQPQTQITIPTPSPPNKKLVSNSVISGVPFEELYLYKSSFINQFLKKVSDIRYTIRVNSNTGKISTVLRRGEYYKFILDGLYKKYKYDIMLKNFNRIENQPTKIAEIAEITRESSIIYKFLIRNPKSYLYDECIYALQQMCEDVDDLVDEEIVNLTIELDREFDELLEVKCASKS